MVGVSPIESHIPFEALSTSQLWWGLDELRQMKGDGGVESSRKSQPALVTLKMEEERAMNQVS